LSEHRKIQNEIIKRLKDNGIFLVKGKKKPKNGRYSGIVGDKRKVIKLDI
jgi:hypothetical protein